MSNGKRLEEIGEVFLAPKAIQLKIFENYFFISKEDIKNLISREVSEVTVQLKGRMAEFEDVGHAFLENEDIVMEINELLFYIKRADLRELFSKKSSSVQVLVETEKYEEYIKKMKNID